MLKTKPLVWIAVGGLLAVTAALAPDGTSPPGTSSSAPAAPGARATEPQLTALPERDALGRPRGEPFAARSWEPQAAPLGKSAPSKPAAVSEAPPVPPPVPYRVAGRVVNSEGAHAVLAKGDAVLAVREGDLLDDGYRVEAVGPEQVTLLYVPLGVRHALPMTSTLALEAPPARAAPVAASSPAQLRWEGPREVRAGDTFDVALKVTSAQAVRASPLQLSFDAKLLEPVGVRAGGFFAGGMFSYRVNPAGSIFVGAAGKGAVASDAELVVLTFRPIGSGAAELKLSSLVLHGAAGSAIAHERPAAFRTAISR